MPATNRNGNRGRREMQDEEDANPAADQHQGDDERGLVKCTRRAPDGEPDREALFMSRCRRYSLGD